MGKLHVLLPVLLFCLTAQAQFAARMEIKEPVKGLCDDKNVYVVFPMFKGQEEAKCPLLLWT